MLFVILLKLKGGILLCLRIGYKNGCRRVVNLILPVNIAILQANPILQQTHIKFGDDVVFLCHPTQGQTW